MTRDNLIAVTKDLGAVMREYVAEKVGEFAGRLKSIEERIAAVKDGAPGERGKDGKDGLNATPIEPAAVIAAMLDGEVLSDELDHAVQRHFNAHPVSNGVKGDTGDQGLKGEPGQDADPAALAELKSEVAALRAALEIQKSLPELVAERVMTNESGLRTIVERMVSTCISELKLPAGAVGQKGEDGRSVTVEEVTPLILSEVSKAIAAVELPKDGAPGERGKDGASVDPSTVEALVVTHVEKSVAALPPLILAEVSKAIAEIPQPKDGEPGPVGPAGKDGVGLAGAFIDKTGELVVTLSDGHVNQLGPVVGKDGAPGPAGVDAVGFDDIDVEFDGERTFALKFVRGEQTKTFGAFTMPAVIYRGTFEDGRLYQKDDCVTWAGAMWIAKEATRIKPGDGEGKKFWTMSSKRGAEGPRGQKGEIGQIGPRGEKGDRGRDGAR